jgi:hypothetical protein
MNNEYKKWFRSQQNIAYEGAFKFAEAAWNAGYQKALSDNLINTSCVEKQLCDATNPNQTTQKHPAAAPSFQHPATS